MKSRDWKHRAIPRHGLAAEAVPKPAEKRELTADELEEPWESMAYYHTGTWKDYLPIRKLSEEEWELYQRKKAQRFQERWSQHCLPDTYAHILMWVKP